MTRVVVVTVFWITLTAGLIWAEVVWMLEHATLGQAFMASLLFTLLLVPFTMQPVFTVWTQEWTKRRNRAGA